MLGTGRLNNNFSSRILLISKNENKHEIAFTNVPFGHDSACFIQKWLRFQRVITVRLAFIS